ncbi:MAG: type II secretion system protein N [Armatimonadota bacterium]
MAFIKTDPSQTKTVIALLVMLVAAIGVTAFRVSHKVPPPPIARAQTNAPIAGRAQAVVMPSIECETSRNPFARPGYVASAKQGENIVDRNLSGRFAPANVRISPWRPGDVELGNEKIAPITVAPQHPAAAQVEAAKETLPVFELMATISGPKGSSAVIEIDQSQAQVVDIGDRVEGGFKVVSIEPERVTLSDGKATIVAKRLMGSAKPSGAQRVESVGNDAK